MSIDVVNKIKFTAKEKSFIRDNFADWQLMPEGEAWTDNMRMCVTWSSGITFTVWRDRYRHDGIIAGLNDWRTKNAKDVISEIAA